MDRPPAPSVDDAPDSEPVVRPRSQSMSQKSDDSRTAADYIREQMQMEADAREAMPYSIETCTKPLGSLRQDVYACLTCNPPPANPADPYTPAGVCYSCSVQCHGEHELVEIFQKRNFTCDCGTTRFSPDQKCTLRINPATNTKGDVHSEAPDSNNKYNHNFRNRFCDCAIDYKPYEQKGTMFQCLGLGTHETGGCGEDWYHPGCLMGLGPKWYENMTSKKVKQTTKPPSNGTIGLPSISEDAATESGANGQKDDVGGKQEIDDEQEEDDAPLPDGFPEEDDFSHFLCYKCVDAYPWIKQYAGTNGFLAPVFKARSEETSSKKRKLEGDGDVEEEPSKRAKNEPETSDAPSTTAGSNDKDAPAVTKEETADQTEKTSNGAECKLTSLPTAHAAQLSLFFKPNFREEFCRCAACFPQLKPHPQLLEEEEAYEPPLSESGSGDDDGASTHGSGNSLLERGESALKNVDRVRAIEGVMAYNHMKEKLKPFFQKFADSGEAIGAEDIKEYFAKLRGDEQGIRDAGEAAKDDSRKEQSGY